MRSGPTTPGAPSPPAALPPPPGLRSPREAKAATGPQTDPVALQGRSPGGLAQHTVGAPSHSETCGPVPPEVTATEKRQGQGTWGLQPAVPLPVTSQAEAGAA